MPIKVECPQCKKTLNAPDGAAGRTAACPKCNGQIRIPGNPAPKASVPRAQFAATPAVSKAGPAVKAGGPTSVAAPAARKPLVAKVLPSKVEPKSASRGAAPQIEELPALDSLGDADPFAGLSIEAVGGDPLAGAALSASPLAAMPAKRRNIDLLPLMVIAGAVLVVCLLGGGLYLLVRGGFGGANVEWLKFMPDEAQMIVHADVQAIRASGLFEKMKQANPAMEEQIQQSLRGTPLRLEDIESVALGGSFQDRDKFVAVVRTNRSVSEDELRVATTTRQETIGQYTLHLNDKHAGARIDDRTLVSGTAEMVKAVLSRNGPPRHRPALQSAVDDADFSSDFTVVMTLAGLPGMNRTVPGAPVDPSQVESLALSADLGSSIELEASIFFMDSSTASALMEKIDQQMSMMRQMMGNLPPQAQEFRSVLDSLSISRSGRKLEASVTIPQSVLDSATSGMRMPAMPAASPLSGTPGKSPSPPTPGRRKSSGHNPNLPPTAPSRGLF